MNHLYNSQLGSCGCNNSLLYNPFKIMNVSSRIIDYDTNLPIDSVNVYLKNKPTVGTITALDGSFVLEAAPDDLVVFSHQSYGTFLPIKAKDILPVEYLQATPNELPAVIVEDKKKKNWMWAAAAIGLFWIVSSGDDDKKKPVKATV